MSRHLTDAELLSFADGELEGTAATTIARHLDACQTCRTRHDRARDASTAIGDLLASGTPIRPPLPFTREHLRTRIELDAERRWTRRAPVVLALTAALVFLAVRFESHLLRQSLVIERGALPVSSLTPGRAANVSHRSVCESLGRKAPRIPTAIRLQVLKDYGMEHVSPDEYELDYLITPELGGLTDRRNLWPEPYGLQNWNAHAKDALEHELPRLVCSRRLDLATAQREIASNWIAAYRKYLAVERPIQLHARLIFTGPKLDW